ncbi:Signal transduction histidine kinase [Minicystis rosea]|nr:Signal transduction histidine kinase [Minicystis rosea]
MSAGRRQEAARGAAIASRAIARHALDTAEPLLDRSLAVAIGVFSTAGTTRYANRGMARLLAGVDGPDSVSARLFFPRFAQLAEAPRRDPVFQGILQFGDRSTVAHSVVGVVRWLDDDLFVFAEFDVVELERINTEVAAVSSEMAGLQRRAERDKLALERALAELGETQSMLVHAEKMLALGQLTAGIAHEINNPLAYVASNARTIGDTLREVVDAYGALDEAARTRDLAEIRSLAEELGRRLDLDFLRADVGDLRRATIEGIARVQGIVDGLKRFARLDEAAAQIADVRGCLQDAIAIAAPTLRKSRIEVSLDLAEVPLIRCRPAELCQVFLNLLVNAAHAIVERGGEGGHIVVRTRAETHRIVIAIGDDGAGMTPTVLGRIFDPFFTTKPVGQGTGLGLTIAHKIIVDRHGGSITATSAPGAGTTFTITLPAEAAS